MFHDAVRTRPEDTGLDYCVCLYSVSNGMKDRRWRLLALAKQIGAIPIDTKDGEVGEQIRELTGGLGADCGSECIGYQCHNAAGKEVPNLVMNSLVDAVKAKGTLGVVGVFVPQYPGADDKLAKKGQIAFDFGKFWFKGQKQGTGQCNVKAYNRRLRDTPMAAQRGSKLCFPGLPNNKGRSLQ